MLPVPYHIAPFSYSSKQVLEEATGLHSSSFFRSTNDLGNDGRLFPSGRLLLDRSRSPQPAVSAKLHQSHGPC